MDLHHGSRGYQHKGPQGSSVTLQDSRSSYAPILPRVNGVPYPHVDTSCPSKSGNSLMMDSTPPYRTSPDIPTLTDSKGSILDIGGYCIVTVLGGAFHYSAGGSL